MRRWLRHHQYALRVALRRLAQHPFSSLANLMVVALSLSLPLLGASVLHTVDPVVRALPVSAQVTVFLAHATPASQAEAMTQQLRADARVAGARLVSRDEALADMRARPAWRDALAVLPGNPLPDAIVVELREDRELAHHADALATEWRSQAGVDLVQLDRDWVRRLAALLDLMRYGLGLLAAAVALVVVATVFNTVRLQALTQREEIGVARLVGATEPFVRRPFLYLGALTGGLGCLAAMGVAALALRALGGVLTPLAHTYGGSIHLSLPSPANLVLAVVLAAVLGALAARWSVSRQSRF